MYILSQDGKTSVNSTTLSSLGIERGRCYDEELRDVFTAPCEVIAYGKGDKEYRMGLYADKEEAIENLRDLHGAMERSEKTYAFRKSWKVYEYCYHKRLKEERDSGEEPSYEEL